MSRTISLLTTKENQILCVNEINSAAGELVLVGIEVGVPRLGFVNLKVRVTIYIYMGKVIFHSGL